MCRVVDGKLVKIDPNPYNPNNFSNISTDFFANVEKEGTCICPKGNAGIATLYDKDRLQKPLRRANPKKGIGIDPGFEEISWDEAYSEIVIFKLPYNSLSRTKIRRMVMKTQKVLKEKK